MWRASVLTIFPELFPGGEVPLPWVEHRGDHLEPALRHLMGTK